MTRIADDSAPATTHDANRIASYKQMNFEFVKIARLMQYPPSQAYHIIRSKNSSVRTPADFLREINYWAQDFFKDDNFSVTRYEQIRREAEREMLEFGLCLDTPVVAEPLPAKVGKPKSEEKRAPQPRAAPTEPNKRAKVASKNNPHEYNIFRLSSHQFLPHGLF